MRARKPIRQVSGLASLPALWLVAWLAGEERVRRRWAENSRTGYPIASRNSTPFRISTAGGCCEKETDGTATTLRINVTTPMIRLGIRLDGGISGRNGRARS